MFFVCTVTDFSAAQKDSGVKLTMPLRLLSRQVFSHFGELWLAWSYGGGITSGMTYIQIAPGKKFRGEARWAVGIEALYGGIFVLLTALYYYLVSKLVIPASVIFIF